MEKVIELALAFIFGSAAKEILTKLLHARKSKLELQQTQDNIDNTNFTIRSEEMRKWMTIASVAEEKIFDLREKLAEEKVKSATKDIRIMELEENTEDLEKYKQELDKAKQELIECLELHGKCPQ